MESVVGPERTILMHGTDCSGKVHFSQNMFSLHGLLEINKSKTFSQNP